MLVRPTLCGTIAAVFIMGSLATASVAAPDVARPTSNAAVSLTIHFPLRNQGELERLIRVQSDPKSPQYHHWLTPGQFRMSFGPSRPALASALTALRAHGFSIARVNSQTIHFTGSAALVEREFATKLRYARSGVTRQRAIMADSTFRLPSDIASSGAQLVSLGEVPAPRAQSERAFGRKPLNRYSAHGLYWFDDLKEAYQYPAYGRANGSGVTIATVNFLDYSDTDAQMYFASEKLGAGGIAPAPVTQHVFVGGPPNPFDPNNSASDEPDLDVQQAGGSAPGATIVGIGDSGYPYFMNAYEYAIETNSIDIVSTSYGECELYYTPPYTGNTTGVTQAMTFHDLYMQGNSQGITFIASSGDEAGLPCGPVAYFGPASGTVYPSQPGVDNFAADPNVTAVGGTNLQTQYVPGKLGSRYVSESEYANASVNPVDMYGTGNYVSPHYFGSGGGTSTLFAEPDYQQLSGLKYSGRAVPDVAMHMGGCPHSIPSVCTGTESRDEFIFNGAQTIGILGTSAAAPEFAGLLAVKESVLHTRMGNENYDLYLLGALQRFYPAFHQNIPGYDGVVTVAPGQRGYNTIVGLGTPIGSNFALTPFGPFAGDPQTASNP